MSLKTIKKIAFLLLVTLQSGFIFAQSNKEDVDLIQAMYGKEKKELVSAYLTIPETKSAAFWTLYDQYEAERKKYGKARIALIEQYANAYETLTDAKAIELMNKKISLYNSFGQLQQKYFSKTSAILGGKEAAKFFQLEDYLENNIRLAIQDEIPFVGELDKTKVPHNK